MRKTESFIQFLTSVKLIDFRNSQGISLSRELLKAVNKHEASQLKTDFLGLDVGLFLQALYPEYKNTVVGQNNQIL